MRPARGPLAPPAGEREEDERFKGSPDEPLLGGAWMVYPFGERVYVSDFSNGLHVFEK